MNCFVLLSWFFVVWYVFFLNFVLILKRIILIFWWIIIKFVFFVVFKVLVMYDRLGWFFGNFWWIIFWMKFDYIKLDMINIGILYFFSILKILSLVVFFFKLFFLIWRSGVVLEVLLMGFLYLNENIGGYMIVLCLLKFVNCGYNELKCCLLIFMRLFLCVLILIVEFIIVWIIYIRFFGRLLFSSVL